jgi:hypothetical protein
MAQFNAAPATGLAVYDTCAFRFDCEFAKNTVLILRYLSSCLREAQGQPLVNLQESHHVSSAVMLNTEWHPLGWPGFPNDAHMMHRHHASAMTCAYLPKYCMLHALSQQVGSAACRQQTAGIKVTVARAAGLRDQDYTVGDLKVSLKCDDQVFTTQLVDKVSNTPSPLHVLCDQQHYYRLHLCVTGSSLHACGDLSHTPRCTAGR